MAKQSDLERRLGELDGLRAKGVITDEEHQARRAAVMSDTTSAPAKKRGMPIFRLGCLGLVGLVVLGVIIAAVSSGSKDDKSKTTSAVDAPGGPGTNKGDVHVALANNSSGEISAQGNGDKKSKVTILQISDNAKSNNQFSQPATGKKYWAAQVMVEATGKAEVTSLDWKLRDSKDVESGQKFVSGVGEGLPVAYTLTPGGKTTGWVVFEIDSDANPKWLRADPNPFLKNDLYFDTK